MGRVFALLSYKLKFFFGPAFRGRSGPLLYVLLIIIFSPSGFGVGVGLGELIKGGGSQMAINFLSAPLAAVFSLGLMLALFGGVTAHVSEFDFFMTAPLRPREYLAADLLFQITSLVGTAGVSVAVGAVAVVMTLGQPLLLVLPLLAIVLAYLLFVLMVMQVLVVLGIKYPGWGVRSAILALVALSLLPSVGLAAPALPRFDAFPFPSTAFASLAITLLHGAAPSLWSAGVALAFVGAGALAWIALSDTPIFHGLKPLLTVGFGQMSAAYNLEKERRMIRGFGGLTTVLRLRPERGRESVFMASLHTIRTVRDGSLLFVGLYVVIAGTPALLGGGGPGATVVTGMFTLPLAILAMNWAFYDRENLWIILTAARTAGAYFRGLMISLTIWGLVVAVAAVAILGLTSPGSLILASVATPVGGSISAAFVATALLIRLKFLPGAFSLAVPALLILVSLGGLLGGLAGQGLLLAVQVYLGWGFAAQAALLGAYLVGLMVAGLRITDRLATSFHL